MNQDSDKEPGAAAGGQNKDSGQAAPGNGANSADSTSSPRAGSRQPNQPAVTPAKTAREIAAAFKAVFGDVEAEMRKKDKVTLEKRLAPYRSSVLLLRQAGKSWKYIANGMKDPRIGQRVTPESLSAVFGPEEERQKAKG